MACELISCSVCSLTRDRTRVPEWGVWNLSHWATREVPLGWLVLKHTWLIKLLRLFFSSTKNCTCSYDLILGSLGGPGMVFLILIQTLMQKHVSSLLRQQGNRHHGKCWLTPSLGSGQWRALATLLLQPAETGDATQTHGTDIGRSFWFLQTNQISGLLNGTL